MNVTPKDGFESAQFLADWAKDEIEQLKALVERSSDAEHLPPVKSLNRRTGLSELRIRFEPPPPRARGLASNVIKNLRDALDQVTHAASFQVAGEAKRNCHFPFASSPNDFDKAVALNQCKHIPEALHPILKAYEPYPTGSDHDGGNNFLRLLGSIAGSHKHRTSLITTVLPAQIGVRLGILNLGKGGRLFDKAASPPDSEGFLVMALGEGGQFEGDIMASTYVAFAHPNLRDTSAIDFLEQCHQSVDYIVRDLTAKAKILKPSA